MIPRDQTKKFVDIIIVTLAVILSGNKLIALFEKWTTFFISEDFNHYYTTSWLLSQGTIPYGVDFRSTPFDALFQWHPNILTASNPPPLALFLYPLSLFDPFISFCLWQLILISALVVSYLLCLRWFGGNFSRTEKIVFGTLFLTSQPAFYTIQFSQFQSVLLLMVLIGYGALRVNRAVIAGIILGGSVALKYFTWPLLFLLLLRRHWLAFSSSIGAGLFFAALPALVYGMQIYYAFFQHGLEVLSYWAAKSSCNIGIPGTIYHLGLVSGENYFESAFSKFLISYAGPISMVLLLALFLNRSRPTFFGSNFCWTLFIAASPIVSPVMWPNYNIFLLPVFVSAWSYGHSEPSKRLLLFISWFLLHIPAINGLAFESTFQKVLVFLAPLCSVLLVLVLAILFWKEHVRQGAHT